MNFQEHVLSRKAARFQVEARDWKEAVKAGTDILVKAGTVTEQYYEEILLSVDELGPYFLIAPGMAMPHACPEGRVLEDSFSIVTLKNPVNFGHPDNDPVDILITLAVVDAKTQNEDAIIQVVTLLDDEKAMADLRKATCIEDLEKIFDELEEMK